MTSSLSSRSVRSLCAAAALAVFGACAAPQHPVAVPPPKPTSVAERRVVEARMLGGIEHFVALQHTRPEMAAVAYAAAQNAWVWCDHARTEGYFCSDEHTARIHEVSKKMLDLRSQGGTWPAPVSWAIVAPPQCREVVQALQPNAPSESPSATLTLDDCRVVHTASAWTGRECVATAQQSCAQPIMRTPPPSGCGDGQPCQQMAPQPMCSCFEGSVRTQVTFSGTWTFGRLSHHFSVSRDAGETIAPVYSDTPPTTPPAPNGPTYIQLLAQSVLSTAGLLLQVASATDVDERAQYCTSLGGQVGPELMGVLDVAHPTCDDAYLRDPIPPVAKPVIAPIQPTLAKDGYPVLAQRFTVDQIAATKSAIEQSAPGWQVTLGALGFITTASLNVSGKSEEAIVQATRAFLSTNFRYLGFEAAPAVKEGGGTYGGPRYVLSTGTAFLELIRSNGRAEIRSHLWPIICPAPDVQKIVRPLLGTPLSVTTPGQPCDPATGADVCTSRPPTQRTVNLSQNDVYVRPKIVPVESSRPDQVELRCGADVLLKPMAVALRPIPNLVDVVTLADLSSTGKDEGQLVPTATP